LRKLNIPGEEEFAGKGVHHCALCDGAFYKDKIIAVAGGSDSAAKEAILLTRYGRKVFMAGKSSSSTEERKYAQNP